MRTPILTFEKITRDYPVLWGSLVFLTGSGFELLMTQKLLGTRVLSLILEKLNLTPQSGFLMFLYHTLTLLLGLIMIALTVHLLATSMKGNGTFFRFLSLLFFLTGVVSLISTMISLVRREQPGLEWLSISLSVLSLLLYIGSIREIYKLSWGYALLAGVVPISLISLAAYL